MLCLILTLLAKTDIHAQYLSDSIEKRPDGITISYFNSDELKNWKGIYISREFQLLFPNEYYKKDYSVKISNKDSLIQRLNILVTKEFIEKLTDCCFEKECPDSTHGYWIILKENDDIFSQCIDKKWTSQDLCGDETLDEVLKIFDALSK